jgi:hypothetical protein
MDDILESRKYGIAIRPNVGVEYFVFDRSRIQISIRRSPILKKGFRNFPQFLQPNSVIIPQISLL